MRARHYQVRDALAAERIERRALRRGVELDHAEFAALLVQLVLQPKGTA